MEYLEWLRELLSGSVQDCIDRYKWQTEEGEE